MEHRRGTEILPGANLVVFRSGRGQKVVSTARGKGGGKAEHPFRISVKGEDICIVPGRLLIEDRIVSPCYAPANGGYCGVFAWRSLVPGAYGVLFYAKTEETEVNRSGFKLVPEELWSHEVPERVQTPSIPGFFSALIGVVEITVQESGEKRCRVVKQLSTADFELKLRRQPFSPTFDVTIPAGDVLGAWSRFAVSAQVGFWHGGSIVCSAGSVLRKCSGEYTLENLPGSVAIGVTLTEKLEYNPETKKITRNYGNPEFFDESGGSGGDAAIQLSKTENSVETKYKYYIGRIECTENGPNYRAINEDTITIGGYLPDEWYGKKEKNEEESSSKLRLCRVIDPGYPAIVQTWESLGAMSQGVQPGEGKLHLLGSNFSDPVSVGDLLIGYLDGGIVDYWEYSGAELVRIWQFTSARPFDCIAGNPELVYYCGRYFLYRKDGLWRISPGFGAAKIDDVIYRSIPSGYNSYPYYFGESYFLWRCEGRWVLTHSLGGGMEHGDDFYCEDVPGTLIRRGPSDSSGCVIEPGQKTLQVGFDGLLRAGENAAPPDGVWDAAELGSATLTPGERSFVSHTSAECVLVADKRSFL